ncbi:hypothetical protein [Burkholderia pseudomallei]|uniref:hypothetical protein n=1 Tax=Burkholderia pseudomallei TaxID=28450 RepID=UPI00053211B1|nr:hypothetical protein [Burkholderia pseudomallei]KGS72580.1 hypothetical protein X942_6076 [Burkholderia pseudomallei MSHR5596]
MQMVELRMLKILIFALVYCAPDVCHPGDDGFPPGKYKIELTNDRPRALIDLGDRYNRQLTEQGIDPERYPIELARHHIIPYKTIKDFFNKLWGEQGRLRQPRKLYTFLGHRIPLYAGSAGWNCQTSASQIAGASNVALALGDGYMLPDGDLDQNQIEEFLRYIAWLPGNIFIGPHANFRSDDPGENGFERDAVYIVGDRRYAILLNTYEDMGEYVKNPSEDLLGAIINNLVKIAQIKSVKLLRREDWINDHGKYRINRNEHHRKENGENYESPLSGDACAGLDAGYSLVKGKYYSTISLANSLILF